MQSCSGKDNRNGGAYTGAPFTLEIFVANPFVEHHLALLRHLRGILVALGEAEQVPEESHALFVERFDELIDALAHEAPENFYLGQDLLCQVFTRYPQIAHLIPRDLLWFFGGDCLHYMPDDEIDLYQQLEDRRHDAEANDEPFDWNQEKQLLAMSENAPRH